jgi:hypothetical protein
MEPTEASHYAMAGRVRRVRTGSVDERGGQVPYLLGLGM